jgi:hypothetical protein
MKLSYLIVLLASFAQNTKIYNQFMVVHSPSAYISFRKFLTVGQLQKLSFKFSFGL